MVIIVEWHSFTILNSHEQENTHWKFIKVVNLFLIVQLLPLVTQRLFIAEYDLRDLSDPLSNYQCRKVDIRKIVGEVLFEPTKSDKFSRLIGI